MSLIDQIAVWLREYLSEAGADGFVLGLSGGVDSATTAGLAVRAAGAERVLGVLMPCHSQELDAELGQAVADAFGIAAETVDLTRVYDTMMAALPSCDLRMASANVKPRLRMTALYYVAQMRNYLVLGSGNKTERMVGYSTKWGDAAADLMPLGKVYKTQVWEMARELGVPEKVIERPPTAGLWPGQTDEGEMGITYLELDRVLQALERGDTDDVEPETLAKVKRMIAGSAHKRRMPPMFPLGSVKE